jgi:HSP20 family protein
MLLQNDPFRDLDFLFSRLAGRGNNGVMAMPLDAYRRGENVWVHIDLPGVAADSLDISVERGVLTVSAERDWQREEGDQVYLTERPRGTFRRQVHLGESLDAERIEAQFNDGVLTLRIPVAEVAKPRKISIVTGGQSGQSAIDASSADTTSSTSG